MFNELAFIDWIALAFAAVLLAGAAAAAVLAYATSRARSSEPRSGYAHAATSTTTTDTPGPEHASVSTTERAAVATSDHQPIHVASGAPQHRAGRATTEDRGDAVLAPTQVRASDEAPIDVVEAQDTTSDKDKPATEEAEPMAEVIDLRSAMPAAAVTEIDESQIASRLASRAAKLRGRPEAETPKAAVALASPSDDAVITEASVAPQAETPTNPRIGFGARVPGFFEDPLGRHELRYWDGNRWTEYVKERGERFTDPL